MAYIYNKFLFEKTSDYFTRKHKTGKNKDNSGLGFLYSLFCYYV